MRRTERFAYSLLLLRNTEYGERDKVYLKERVFV